MRKEVSCWRGVGESVGIVPTMGALHDGHLALIQDAKSECDRVIVTIFVNPTQFADNEDLHAYPRVEDEDIEKLRALKIDLVFIPDIWEMYPEGFSTKVSVERLSKVLCGLGRPSHFDGVVTIVSKLFIQSRAGRAYFGEKDYQQFLIVRRMAKDLDIPIEVVLVTTKREADGLAMSSRNVYLSPGERSKAPLLYKTLKEMAHRIKAGLDAEAATTWGRGELGKGGFDRIEYLEVRDTETLDLMPNSSGDARIFVAVHLGKTRLIDNVLV